MSKKLRLSHSQVNTYKDCARKWWLDKVKRLRPTYKGSALIFGSSLDSSVEHILLKKEGSAEDEFRRSMKNFEVNGINKTVPEDVGDIRFFAGDVDSSLFEASDLDTIGAYCDSIEIDMPDTDEFLEYCKQMRKQKKVLKREEQLLFNYMAFTSLNIKGLMILEKVAEWIEENVAEVHGVQQKISIENDEGDAFIGFLDFIVTLKSGKKVLIDLKTSSNPRLYYPSAAATESVQLGIYSQETQVMNVAYLVGDKKIRKREPRVRLHFIEGIITEEHLDDVFDGIAEVTMEIKEKLEMGEGAFDKNLDSCMKFSGCPYFNYCKKGSMKGLCHVKKV